MSFDGAGVPQATGTVSPPTALRPSAHLVQDCVTDIFPLPKASEVPALILGALTSIGGITGYVRTGSVPSIVAGLTVGALYGLGGYRISQRQKYGVELALLASVVLAGSSIPRAIKSGKTLPMGLSVVASFGLWQYGMAFYNSRK